MKTPFQAKIFKETFCSQLHTFTLEMQRRSLHFFSFLKRSCKDSDKKDTFWIWSSLLGTALLSRNFCESVLRSFWLWVMFNRMDVPHLVTIRWTFELLAIWGYYEFCSLNYSSMSLGLDMCFLTRADIRSRVAGSSGKRVFNFLRHRLLSKCAVWPHHVFQVFSSSPTLVIRVFYNSRPSECALVCHSHFPNDQ